MTAEHAMSILSEYLRWESLGPGTKWCPLFRCQDHPPIAMAMSMVDSRPIASAQKSTRRSVRPLVFSCVVAVVFLAAVVAMSIRDGAGGAFMTALLAVVLVATAFGVWGTTMAVRETEELGSHAED